MLSTVAPVANVVCNARSVGLIVLSALLTTGLTACGAARVVPSETATVTVTALQGGAAGAGVDKTSPQPPAGPEPDGGVTPDEGDTSGSPVAPSPGQITLASFFNPQGWQENRYDVADRKQVQGVTAGLGTPCGAKEGGAELELRLGAAYQRLRFATGQSQDSASSQEEMTVRIFAGNEQVDIKKVPFGQIQTFDLDVARVNALRIRFIMDSVEGNSCSSEVPVNAVLFDGTLQ